MLWYKAWHETRWRLVGLIGMFGVLLLPQMLGTGHASPWKVLKAVSPMLDWLAAMFLSGAGVNTQTAYRSTAGFHKSMLYTLSLPVSRQRLFSVRAGLGAIEAGLFVLILAVIALAVAPEPLSAIQCIAFVARVEICTLAVYGLFSFLATFLDDMWRMGVGAATILAQMILQSRYHGAANFSPMEGMSVFSHPAAAAGPASVVITSAVLCVVFAWLSIRILRRKEY